MRKVSDPVIHTTSSHTTITVIEKIELALIPVVGLGIWAVCTELPRNIHIEKIFLYMSVLVLLQGLIRDTWLLIKQKRSDLSHTHTATQCLCLESTIGITGVVAGILLPASSIDGSIAIKSWMWSILAVAVMIVGFLIKDYVVKWNPIGIHRDKHHINIKVAWKKS